MPATADLHRPDEPSGPPSVVDDGGLEVLSRDECVALLAPGGVGRVAVTMRALPVILPVGFSLVGEDVVFDTSAGTRLAAAVAGAVVAFEADDVDPTGRAWSVCVTGVAIPLDDPGLPDVVRIPVWPPGDQHPDRQLMRISSQIVTGRRVPRL